MTTTGDKLRVTDEIAPSAADSQGVEEAAGRPRRSVDALKRAIGWAAGIPFASARYVARDVKIQREDSGCGWPLRNFPEGEVNRHRLGLKLPSQGSGDAYRRLYRVSVERPLLSAQELMAIIHNDPGVASPLEIARFEKTKGHPGRLDVGDEFRVRLPGPWNGPVRVIGVTSSSFRLGTLEGHMEAGEIEFRASRVPDGRLHFEIESWARSANRVFGLLYDRLGASRELQLHMWAHFLERVAQISGGTVSGAIQVHTERCDQHPY